MGAFLEVFLGVHICLSEELAVSNWLALYDRKA